MDFTHVSFCDSTARAVLLRAQKEVEAQGSTLVVRSPSVLLQRMATFLGSGNTLGVPTMRWPTLA